MKLNRRRILLAGLTTAVATKVTTDLLRKQQAQAEQAALEELAARQIDTQAMLDQAFSGDTTAIEDIRKIRTAVNLVPPTTPYSRDISKLLIRCNKLTTEQYIKGKIEPTYDGSISDLPDYDAVLSRYTQVGSLIGEETQVTERVEVNIPSDDEAGSTPAALRNRVRQAENTLTDTVQEIVNLRRTIQVYFGFVLQSDQNSLILLRGTQRRNEWLANISALQETYRNYQDEAVLEPDVDYGGVHIGFAGVYWRAFHTALLNMARQLDPSLPCYVSGHSLGGALATMAVLDLALHLPELRPQLQLYTYASPRVGDPVFANLHSRIVPNSYRVVNLADTVPLVPPTKLGADYAHVGQSWSFLSQNGDLLPNHLIEVYRNAITQGLEIQDGANYQNLSII
jgi:predicted lipase